MHIHVYVGMGEGTRAPRCAGPYPDPTLPARCSTAYLYLTWQVLHRIVSPERVEYARDQSCGLQVNKALEPILT